MLSSHFEIWNITFYCSACLRSKSLPSKWFSNIIFCLFLSTNTFSLAALIVGCLADHVNRAILFAWTVGIGEGACFLTYWTTTYLGLYICRAVTGFSIGGALPLIYSILGDMYAADERHSVNALVGIGTGLGISVGQGVAGFLGPAFGWRLPFLVVSIPALACAVAVLLTVKDPERGGMEEAVLEMKKHTTHNGDNPEENGDALERFPTSKKAQKEMEMQQLNTKVDHFAHLHRDHEDYSESSQSHSSSGVRRRSLDRSSKQPESREDVCEKGPLWVFRSTYCEEFYRNSILPTAKAMKILLSTPTVVLALMQGAPGCLPWGVVNTYLNDFLAEDRGMSVEFATFTILCFGVGNFIGLFIGGAGGQYLYRVDRRYPALLAGSMAIFGCVPFWVLLNGVDSNTPAIPIATIAILAGTASGITGPIIKATLQNVTLPHMRGQAFALFNTFDDFGRGLGPVFVAKMITVIGSRTPAFNIGTLGWVVCGIFNLTIFFTSERDEKKTQATISANMNKRADGAIGLV